MKQTVEEAARTHWSESTYNKEIEREITMDIEEAKNKKAKAETEIAHILEKLETETGLKVSNMFYICRENDKSALAVSPIEHIKTNIILTL